MKNSLLIILTFFTCGAFISQTAEQSRAFINKSQIAVFKVQKEMISQSLKINEADFRNAIRDQAIAVKFHKAGKFAESIAFSYKARMKSIELLEGPNKSASGFFNPTQEEKNLVADTSLSANGQLTKEESKKIEELNILDTQKLREIELNINQ
jgi:hypothetical protein